jgi:hypothetical protein
MGLPDERAGRQTASARKRVMLSRPSPTPNSTKLVVPILLKISERIPSVLREDSKFGRRKRVVAVPGGEGRDGRIFVAGGPAVLARRDLGDGRCYYTTCEDVDEATDPVAHGGEATRLAELP